jgi:hypothetical protein
MVNENVEAVIKKAENNFKCWSRRSLSTLGKILIVKTFGISQVIHVLQALTIKECHIKQINAALYKFIWNRHYLAARAPERIKREILCTPVKQGGYGMLDVSDLDKSLKLKMFGRMLATSHPFLSIIRGRIRENFFKPEIDTCIEGATTQGLEIVSKVRDKLWGDRSLDNNVRLLRAIRDTRISSLIGVNGSRSIPYFNIRGQGKRVIGDLNMHDIDNLRRYIREDMWVKIKNAVGVNPQIRGESIWDTLYDKGKFVSIGECTSKKLREIMCPKDTISKFKIGLELSEIESKTWLQGIQKLTSSRHKNNLLRVLHGEVYTQERLARFGLSDDVGCPRCDLVETLEHKIYMCPYVERIWDQVIRICNIEREANRLEAILGVHSSRDLICLHAEIITRILYLPRDRDYLIHPKHFVRSAIKSLLVREKSTSLKSSLNDMLGRL